MKQTDKKKPIEVKKDSETNDKNLANDKPTIEPGHSNDQAQNKDITKSIKNDGDLQEKSNNSVLIEPQKEKIMKLTLPDSEILASEEIIIPIKKNENFVKVYTKNLLKNSELPVDLLSEINSQIYMKHSDTRSSILNKKIKFSQKSISVDEIIAKKKNKKDVKQMIEKNIKDHKIKELRENKTKLETKIKSLDENIKLIETGEASKLEQDKTIGSTLIGKELIEKNIRESKIKEINRVKQMIEDKIVFLDIQINEILKDEAFLVNNSVKKFDVKTYLENFERDKKEAELRELKWKKDQMQRAKKFEEEQMKLQEKIKERAESDELYYNQKKQEEYQKRLEKMKNKNHIIKEDITKLNKKKEEWKSNPIKNNDYLFKKLEEQQKKLETEEQEEMKNKMIAELAKKKILFKPITRTDLEQYKKEKDEELKKIQYEKEKEKLLKKEELMQKNSLLPKSETKIYEKIVEEEKKIRENQEKIKLDKVYNSMKIKQFSKVVLKDKVPKIDEEKRKEMQELISKSQNIRPDKLTYNKNKRIILKKPDLENPKKYNWDLKLDDLKIERKGKTRSLSGTSKDLRYGLGPNNSVELSLKRISSAKAKRAPMIKNPDYLTVMRSEKLKVKPDNAEDNIRNLTEERENKAKKWKKIINNDKNSFTHNVEQMKLKAMKLEEEAKRKEKLINLNGGAHKNPMEAQAISNMLIDSLKAKLTILENVSKKQ